MKDLSARARLLLLLVLAAIPALALTIYNSFDQRATAESEARAEVANLARVGAQQQAQILEGAKQLLVGFSLIPAELRDDRARCGEYVKQMLQNTGRLYLSMGLYGPAGDVQCSGTPPERAAQTAVASGQLSIGEYPVATPAKPEGFTLGYPIPDSQRTTPDVAFVVLNLAEFGQLAMKLPLPEGGVLTVVDRNGVVLARNPGGAELVGRKLDSSQIPDQFLVGKRGVFSSSITDRKPQLFAYESVTESDDGPAALRVIVGVPLSVIYAEANATLTRTLGGVILLTLLLLIGAYYGAERFFLRNVRTLLETANRIRNGDLAARTGMTYGHEELSQIGKAFDEMVETLQERQIRIDNTLDTLHQQSITDALTGLHNRRYLYETLPREIVRGRRNGATVGVIIVDLDHFKRINDTYGHEAGDMALRWVGNVLTKSVRGSDVVSRYGGEEFCLALPEATQAVALAKAEEIRQALEKLNIDYCGKPLRITASFGVAIYPEHGTDADTLLRVADEALYKAKHAGRNRVVVYSEDAEVRAIRTGATTTIGRGSVAQLAAVPATSAVSDIKGGSSPRRGPGGGPPLRPVDGTPLDRPAAIQVLTGKLVGKELPLVKTATTVGTTDGELAMITRSTQGYFITHVQGEKFPVVNGSTIEARARFLNDRDVIQVAGVKMVFFFK